MAKYRPSKRFVWSMTALLPLTVAFYAGFFSELDNPETPPAKGEITFSSKRPERGKSSLSSGASSRSSGQSAGFSLNWLNEQYESLMSWEHNPWKRRRASFGDHYMTLASSKDPYDQARTRELRRLGAALFQKVLARYPELAVTFKTVPAEQNGFLKWLELCERFEADPSRPGDKGAKELGIPDSLKDALSGKAPWNAADAKAWLAKEQSILDELRAIGALHEQSINGIDVERWGFISARFAKSCSEALMIEARLAAEAGDSARALESIAAARQLADHFGNVETPSLLAVTVQLLLQMQVQNYALKELIPTLPPGSVDLAQWEAALKPVVSPPAEFSRIMRGEWQVGSLQFVMPMMVDTEDPRYPPDPEALIDFHASMYLDYVSGYDRTSPSDWPAMRAPAMPAIESMSGSSRDFAELMFVGARAWSNGFQRAQSNSGMMQAAFAIMQGQPIPNDPVYGQSYGWDPATRTLSPPDSPEFKELQLKPIVVPKL